MATSNDESGVTSLVERKLDVETEMRLRLAAAAALESSDTTNRTLTTTVDTENTLSSPATLVTAEKQSDSDRDVTCNNNNVDATNLMNTEAKRIVTESPTNASDLSLHFENSTSSKIECDNDCNRVFVFSDVPKSSHKSVSFHSITSNPGEKKITSPVECVRFMINGSTLIKIKSNSRQYRRYFSLEEDLSAIKWVPSSKKSSKAKLNIRSVREVRTGKNTDALKMKEICGAYAENCAFSIIYGDEFESLDLIASTPEDSNIWVTGINYLIGACKSAESMDCNQTMREKWLHDVFDEADADRKGMLDEDETIALMKKLNSQLCIRQLKQKIMEFDCGKDEEDRRRINKKLFVTLFKEISTRPDIYLILVRYCGKDLMSVDDLQLFLEGEQGICATSVDDCERLICKYERSEEAINNKQLLIDGFTQLLLSEDCDISNTVHNHICQDMRQPLSHYFVATSHNTYLVEDQLKGPSSLQGYVNALKNACRCIKVDCWDGISGPVVYHGNTLTSKLAIVDVFQTIKEYAFFASEYPLIIHLENHCSLSNQKYIASLIKDTFQSSLYIPNKELCAFNCLEDLKGKIIIQGKKLTTHETEDGEVSDEDDSAECHSSKDTLKRVPLCKELSDLTSLIRTRCYDLPVVHNLRTGVKMRYILFSTKAG